LWGQGNLCIYVFNIDPKSETHPYQPDFSKPLFKEEHTNNVEYDYCLYKNFCPIIKFGDSIFYMKVINEYANPGNKSDDPKITFDLMEYNMAQKWEKAKKVKSYSSN